MHSDESRCSSSRRPATRSRPLTDAVRELHPYENFELVALDVAAGAPEYLQWIAGSVTPPGGA